tara:strand:+ start:28 stop:465 length:438 start_codon:yes stop_codon:yes gene_type:complete
MILPLLGLAIYIFILISPLVLIDILSGWAFLIYPLYISTDLLLERISQDDWVETNGEPPDGREGRWGVRNGFNQLFMAFQGVSALIFFIIFAFNDGAAAFSTVIIGSIILAIVIIFKRYFNSIWDNYTKFLEWVYSIYKKFFRGY